MDTAPHKQSSLPFSHPIHTHTQIIIKKKKSHLGRAASFPCKWVCKISEVCVVRPAMSWPALVVAQPGMEERVGSV